MKMSYMIYIPLVKPPFENDKVKRSQHFDTLGKIYKGYNGIIIIEFISEYEIQILKLKLLEPFLSSKT